MIGLALEAAGVSFSTRTYEKLDVPSVNFEDQMVPDSERAATHPGISLLSLNGEHLAGFHRSGGHEVIDDRYVISVWFWETEKLPAEALGGLNYVDEVWAGSPFIKQTMERAAGNIPVRLFNHPIQPNSNTESAARERFPFADRFVFAFAFDYHSCVKRKNPQAVCEAFAKAFPQPSTDGPLLIIKSINGNKHGVEFNLVKWKWADRSDIIFLDGFLSPEDRELFMMRVDAYVSLHRAEGLGLTMLEAMAAGKPCIATGYSGNLAFMNEGNSWLIPYEKVAVGKGSLHYPSHHEWAEPSIEAAARAMTEVYAHQAEARKKAHAGQTEIISRHNIKTAGLQMATLLQDSARRMPRKKELGDRPVAEREAAHNLIAELRSLEESLIDSRIPTIGGRAALKRLQETMLKFSKTQRRALSHTLRALKQSEQQQRGREEQIQQAIRHIRHQLEQIIAHIKL